MRYQNYQATNLESLYISSNYDYDSIVKKSYKISNFRKYELLFNS